MSGDSLALEAGTEDNSVEFGEEHKSIVKEFMATGSGALNFGFGFIGFIGFDLRQVKAETLALHS